MFQFDCTTHRLHYYVKVKYIISLNKNQVKLFKNCSYKIPYEREMYISMIEYFIIILITWRLTHPLFTHDNW